MLIYVKWRHNLWQCPQLYCTYTHHNIHTAANTHIQITYTRLHTHKYIFEQKLTVAERDGGKPLYRSKKSSSVVTSRKAEKDNNQNNEKAGRQCYCWLIEVWLNTVMEARQPDWDTTEWSMAQHGYGSKTTGLRHHGVEYGSTRLWKQDNWTETPLTAVRYDWDTRLKKYSSTQLRKQDNLTETPPAIKQSHKITTWSRQPTKLRPSSHKDQNTAHFLLLVSSHFLLLVFWHQKNYNLHN